MTPQAATTVKAEAVSAAIALFTGERPVKDVSGETITIRFTQAQVKQLQALLSDWLGSPSGPLRIDVAPVVVPVMLKRMFPYAAIAAVGGGLLFWRKKHGKR